MYFGAPFSDASSIKSKSRTKFKEAIITTNKLTSILVMDPLVGSKIAKPPPKKLAIKEIR